jgi:PIN domain nuclease of toxin-antitoxin system
VDALLDTCCLIWALNEPERLSDRARQVLGDPDTVPIVSPVSCAELACLWERKRVAMDRHWRAWFRHYVIEVNDWTVEVIDLNVVEEAWSLPGEFPPDPADRVLIATARLRGYTILTADRRILEYPHVKSLW